MSFKIYPALLLVIACLSACSTTANQRARHNSPLDPAKYVGPASKDWDTPPRLIKGKSPIYPASLVLSDETGSALIVYTVGTDGKTKDFQVEASTNEKFVSHAIIALQQWIFSPALKDGVPIEVRLRQKFSFND